MVTVFTDGSAAELPLVVSWVAVGVALVFRDEGVGEVFALGLLG